MTLSTAVLDPSKMLELRFSASGRLLVSLALIFTGVVSGDDCPQNCTCDFTKDIHNCTDVNTMPQFLHPNKVRALSINSQNITEIKKTDFKGYFSMRHLNLSGGIAAIAEHAFDDMKAHVELINLNNNQLQVIPENLFTNMTRLKTLEINYNKLTRLNGSLFTNLPKLNIIKFELNGISEIGDNVFQNVPNLETVYFFKNKLTEIPFKALQNVPSLKHLFLGFNKITSVGDLDLQYKWLNLTDISLDTNQISDLTVFPKFAPNLGQLDLGFNQFSTISPLAWTNLDSLQELNLNGNKMKGLNAGVFSGLKNLDHIYLRNMPELESIGPRVFTDMKNLRFVDIAVNPKLKQIHEDAFQDTQITSLYLDHNGLTSLSQKLLPLMTLAHISLDNNTWNCDCNLGWILNPNIVYNSSDVKSKIQGLNCSSPAHLKGKSINSLKTSDLVCGPSKSEDYKSRVETGIIVAVVCFVVMSTFAIVMKCRKRIILRVRKYYMYRRFKAADGVFTVGEKDTEMDDENQLL